MPRSSARAVAAALCFGGLVLSVTPLAAAAPSDDVLSVMRATNADLKAMWMDYRLESVEFFSVGQNRPSSRIHQLPYRWVNGDPRRQGEARGLTWTLDPSWGEATASGLTRSSTEQAVRRAMASWASDRCLTPGVHEIAPPAGDLTVTDWLLGDGGFGDPFAADVVFAGFHAGGEPFFRADTLAFTATYVFIDPASGEPTDRDHDGNMDVALVEVWLNDGFPWSIAAAGDGIDLETAALHEAGHAFGLGHFGPPPAAVMNPAYSGVQRQRLPIDHSGLCTVWGKGAKTD